MKGEGERKKKNKGKKGGKGRYASGKRGKGVEKTLLNDHQFGVRTLGPKTGNSKNQGGRGN